jgi:hypothetical protein
VSGEGSILTALNLGSSKKVLEGATDSPLTKLLNGLTQDVVDSLRSSASKYDIQASTFNQEIKPTSVKLDGSVLSVGISAPFYWKFLNYGVNGSKVGRGAPSWGATPSAEMSMSDSLRQWEGYRGVVTSDGVYTNWTSISKVEGMSIAQRGVKPRPFFTDVVNDKLAQTLKDPIEKLLKRSIEIVIVEPWQ